MCPLEYGQDLNSYLGFILPHDDSVNDRSEGSRLCRAQDRTEELWRGERICFMGNAAASNQFLRCSEHFGARFSRPGCMWRGEPPRGRLAPLTEQLLRRVQSGSICSISLGGDGERGTFKADARAEAPNTKEGR